MKYKIYNQDVMEWAKQYEKAKFHALLSDAPYHLTSIVKRFGKKGSAPAQFGTDGVFSRSSKGFMGTTWDGGDVAFRPETWAALGEHLYPGAFGMVFSASRNWHRLAVAIEDAGMVIHPTIFGWLNGQGFPKASNISKRLDRNAGVEMKSVPATGVGMFNKAKGGGGRAYNRTDGGYNETKNRLIQVGKSTPESDMWYGHRYGLQALKPAVEPIIIFQKPYDGRPLDNIVSTGAGALNIDAARVPVDAPVTINRFTNGAKPWGDAKGEEFETVQTSQGRWPANFILDESVAERLDAQSGTLTSGKPGTRRKKLDSKIYGGGNGLGFDVSGDVEVGVGDSGGASRFFYNVQEHIDEADPIYYCGKVSPKERNAGLDDLGDKEKERWGTFQDARPHTQEGYVYEGKPVKNNHPTLKPISLAKYLATLLLPPEGYAPRRIMIPFSGVGSEMIGAALAGWEHIVGIEFDKENGYIDMAHKRMEYWTNK